MKKIIIVNASPRPKGNCGTIANRLVDQLDDAEVELVLFRNKDINYCKACDACKRMDALGCAQKDDMTALLPDIDNCDALVLLSPIYWNDLSAQAKTFVDRFYAFVNPAQKNMSAASKFGKKIAIITTNGTGDPAFYAEKSQALADGGMGAAGFTESKVLAFGGISEPGSAAENADYMQKVDDLAKWLIA